MPRSSTVIDLHCHVLPGIDDGPATLEGSLELARAAAAGGTTVMVATPHVSWNYPGNCAALIEAKVAELNAALVAEQIGIEVLAGAELALTRAVDLPDEELAALRLGDGPWLLVECPLSPNAPGFEGVLRHLQGRGHRLVLAHPERSPSFHRRPELLDALVCEGMLTQVTAGALVGRFGRTVQAFADTMIRRGIAHDVASDAHSTDRRPPGMRSELEASGFGPQARWLTLDVPAAICSGGLLPPAPAWPPAPSRRRLGGLLRPR